MAALLGVVVGVVVAGDDDSRLDFGVDGILYGGSEEACCLSTASYSPDE